MNHKIKKVIMSPVVLIATILNNVGTWVFEYASRIIELLNTWGMVGFGSVMLYNNTSLLTLTKYNNFTVVPRAIWSLMILIGVIQFILLCKTTNSSNQLSAIVLQLSAIIWVVIAMGFAFQPPISTALPIYMGMALVTGLTGYELLRLSKQLEE